MYEKLRELVGSFEEPMKNYRVSKENRQILKMIMNEAFRLRKEISKKVQAEEWEKE